MKVSGKNMHGLLVALLYLEYFEQLVGFYLKRVHIVITLACYFAESIVILKE